MTVPAFIPHPLLPNRHLMTPLVTDSRCANIFPPTRAPKHLGIGQAAARPSKNHDAHHGSVRLASLRGSLARLMLRVKRAERSVETGDASVKVEGVDDD